MKVPFTHTLAALLDALLSDNQLAYGSEWQGNHGPLAGVKGSSDYASVLGNMKISGRTFPDDRLETLVNVLRGMTSDASRVPYSSLEQTVMRGLNPRNVRAYGG